MIGILPALALQLERPPALLVPRRPTLVLPGHRDFFEPAALALMPFPAAGFGKAAGAGAPVYKSFLFSGTTSYMELASAPVTAYPFTFSIWFNSNSPSTSESLFAIGGTTSRAALDCGTTNTMEAAVYNTTGTIRASAAPATFGSSAWHHLVGVFDNATSRTAWQDGVAGTTNTISVTPSSMAKTTIGCRYSSGSRGDYWHGNLAHAAIWNMSLSGTDIANLYAGTLPSAVQAGNLVFYADLQGGIAKDSITSTSLTVSNASAATDGPF